MEQILEVARRSSRPVLAAWITSLALLPASRAGGAELTDSARAQAVRDTVARDPRCASLTSFYWEIGDRRRPLASGQGGDPRGRPVDPDAAMPIASASKLIFGAYALETQPFDRIVERGWDAYLNFTSGYDGLRDGGCLLARTVGRCFAQGGDHVRNEGHVGRFSYDGGHLQAYAVLVAGLGPDLRSNLLRARPLLADDIQRAIGEFGLAYGSPMLAGGARVAPSGYALFLRTLLSRLRLREHLGERSVCAWTHHDDCDAVFSPVNESAPGVATNDVSDMRWRYSLAHWVEDDGAFSSPGLFGFYPWIDPTKTYYGLLARHDTRLRAKPPPYIGSVLCGRLIRRAWLTGHEQ